MTTKPHSIDHYRRRIAALENELAELRSQIEQLGDADGGDHQGPGDVDPPARANVYVFDDNDDEARAFDAFYRAYDGHHAKTRKFLLG